MAKKVYKSVTGDVITFPVIVSGAKVWIDCNPDYETTVSEVQTAIEAHSYFTSGNIMTSGNITDQVKELSGEDVIGGKVITSEIAVTEGKEKDPFKLTIFDEVTTINQAKDTLRNEPYNINHQKLRTPEAIMAQAIEHSVSFPNWVI